MAIPTLLTSVSVLDSSISNIKVEASNNIFTIGGFLFLQINNFTAEKVTSLDPTDASSSIFNILNIVLDNPYNSSVTSVDYVNSTITFMKISAFTGPTSATKYFTFENMNFSD